MGEGFRGPGGGLPAAARALLIPENIRAGVHIKGGGVDVVGTASVLEPTLTYLYNKGSIAPSVGALNGPWANSDKLGHLTYDFSSCYFSNAIDVTPFRSLSFMQWAIGGYVQNGYYVRVGLAVAPGAEFSKVVSISSQTDSLVASVDISELTGYHYIRIEKSAAHQNGVRQIMLNI